MAVKPLFLPILAAVRQVQHESETRKPLPLLEIRKWRFENGNSKLKTASRKAETRTSKLENRNSKIETQNRKLQAGSAKLENRDSKVENQASETGKTDADKQNEEFPFSIFEFRISVFDFRISIFPFTAQSRFGMSRFGDFDATLIHRP